MNLNPCPQCGQPTPRALCTICCAAITRANQIADWDEIPASERGDTSRQLTDAVIETMRALSAILLAGLVLIALHVYNTLHIKRLASELPLETSGQ